MSGTPETHSTMRRFLRHVGLILALAVAPAAEARDLLTFAQSYVGGRGAWWVPFFECAGPACRSYVLVYVRSDEGLRSVRFSAPLPPCLSAGIIDFEFETPYRVVGDDIQDGITVEFDECLASTKDQAGYIVDDIFVGRIRVVILGDVSCCSYFPIPDPTALSRRVEGQDCNSNLVLLSHRGVTFNYSGLNGSCGVSSMPYGEYPLDGSETSPNDVTLDWDTGTSAGTNLGTFRQLVYLGTDPNDLELVGYEVVPPLAVGALNPNQTYYWRVFTSLDFGTVTGPTWSFTTASSLPVKSVTWGQVKMLWK